MTTATLALSPDQMDANEAIADWAMTTDEPEFRLGGLAGTGKTSISAMLPALLRGNSVEFCAPTGRAASILTRKLGVEARTLHSRLYIADSYTEHFDDCLETDTDEGKCRINCVCPTSLRWIKRSDYQCDGYCGGDCMAHRDPLADIMVVDESSMVGRTLYKDIMELKCRKLWVGDYGQLPPMMDGKGVLSEDNLDARLTTLHRQAGNPTGNNIVELAHAVRQYGKSALANYSGEGVAIKRMKVAKANLLADPNRMVICWKNSTRVAQNAKMREQLGLPHDTLTVGDKVICLRNNRDKKVYNGQMGFVTAINKTTDHLYYVDIAMENGSEYSGKVVRNQFNQERTLNDSYGDLFDYAYCITAHKSQGSESEEVVVLAEGAQFNGESMGASDPRWLYTAITRAKSKLTVVLP